MNFNKLVVGILIFNGFTAVAKPENTTNATLLQNRDTEVRSAHRFIVNGSAGNIAGGVSGAGVEAMYRKDSKLEYGFEFHSGSVSLIDRIEAPTGVKLDVADLNAKYYGGIARYFVGNSFAINGGLGYRQIDSLIRVSSNTSAIQSSSSGDAFYARVGVGNYWAWNSGFSLGCEWIGAQVPLNSKYGSESQSRGVSSSSMESVRETGEDLGKSLAKSTIFQVLNLKIGYTF